MTDPTELAIMIYPVKGRAYTGEKWNACLGEGDILSDEIGWGETPADAVQHLMKTIAEDVNSIIEEEVDHA